MKLKDAILGTPVIFWGLKKGTNERGTPHYAVIKGKPYAPVMGRGHGAIVVKVTDQEQPAQLTQLDLITPDVVREINKRGFNAGELIKMPEISDLQRRQIDWLNTYEFCGKHFKNRPEMPTVDGDELLKKEIQAFSPGKAEEYEPFGPEWEQYLMGLPKKQIIGFYRAAAISRKSAYHFLREVIRVFGPACEISPGKYWPEQNGGELMNFITEFLNPNNNPK